MNTNNRLHGNEAIEYARAVGAQLYKYSDPVEDSGPVSLDTALDIASVTPSLIYVDAVTDAEIAALRDEAGAAGDTSLWQLATLALFGESADALRATIERARVTCVRAILDARAMED